MATLTPPEQAAFADALHRRLHGDAQEGFDTMVRVLAAHGLAKWPIVSALPAYLRPQDEVFVKPTVAKAVVTAFALPLTYRPRPDWAFYTGFRDAILEMKAAADPSLGPSTMAFTGFLMMTLRA